MIYIFACFFPLGQCFNIVFLGTPAVAFSCLLMLKKKKKHDGFSFLITLKNFTKTSLK